MTNKTLEILIVIIPFMTYMIALLIINIIKYRQRTEARDVRQTTRSLLNIMMIAATVIVVGSLVLMDTRITIRRYDDKSKKYDKAVKSGYTLYYNGQHSEADALGITRNNISDYSVVFDDDKRIIRVKEQ